MTIVFLALLTLVEGVRRVPRGSVVLQRVMFGQWRIQPPEPGDRRRLLSWWSPFMTSIVLAPREKYQDTEGPDVRTALFDLRLLGLVELVALVLGVPLALQRFGATGFLAALGAVLLLCLTIVTALAVGAHSLGRPWRAALRFALPFVSPFSAPRAAEALLEVALGDVAPAVASRALLPADAFLRWVRPLVYDARNGGEVDRRLLEGLNLSELDTALASQNGQGMWCRRCGATFVQGKICSECDIQLVPMGTSSA